MAGDLVRFGSKAGAEPNGAGWFHISSIFEKTIGYLEGILLYLRDTLTRKPKVGSVCGLSN
jgi:hypothetical protein